MSPAVMNITLDDTSPQLVFSSRNDSNLTWIQDHTADSLTYLYFKKTFMGTRTDGDYMFLAFNGTAITIYGAKRSNHGNYSTKLDGQATVYHTGYSATPQFQVPIFQASSLSPDMEHQLLLQNWPSYTNASGTNNTEWWLDVDYAVITTSTTGKVWTTSYDDQSPEMRYVGLGWRSNPDMGDGYYNQSAHISPSGFYSDWVSLTFNGSSFQVFGGLYVDHGQYSVALDGITSSDIYDFNGTYFDLQTGVSLFHASGLEEGRHTVKLTNLGGGPKGSYFDIDYIVVNSTVEPTLPSNTTASSLPSSSPSSMSSGAIAGAVVGGVVALGLVVALTWFLTRRNRNKNEPRSLYPKPGRMDTRMDLNGDEVNPFFDDDPQTLHRTPSGRSSYVLGSLGQGAAVGERMPFLSGLPAPPGSNAPSYPRSVDPLHNASSVAEGVNSNGPWQSSAKSAGVALPYTARPPTQSSPASSLNTTTPSPAPSSQNEASSPPVEDFPNPHLPYTSAITGEERQNQLSLRRMYVPGREQDVGPFGDRAEVEEVLPPDYNQATESLPGQRMRE
ncbi:hypothetical protein B9479_002194 [Cryptococcus floricola]|uniref:Transmembrane protein n=1 Tax=Cryptococcus floricola TaxID=2591691 RepID=A0A5D3B4N6_9TREE|nr:hypothetical protein B9479_002194 [Cryptococcus floricola]